MNKVIHIFSKNNITYLSKLYPENHWAMQYPKPSDDNFVAQLSIKDISICLKLNPTDSRGYRGIATLINKDMRSTFNRKYNINEKLALNISLAIFAEVYESFGLIAQMGIAGNNSQKMTDDKKIQYGTEEVSSTLHGHVIARGKSGIQYISDVPLRGPPIGSLFNMRGEKEIIKNGKFHKAPWLNNEIKTVANALSGRIPIIAECLSDVKIISLNNCSE
jgi:hypothetical protein